MNSVQCLALINKNSNVRQLQQFNHHKSHTNRIDFHNKVSLTLKNYSAFIYVEVLGSFSDYQNFENINDTHFNFIQRVKRAIDLVPPTKSNFKTMVYYR